MRMVIQRVKKAKVRIENKVIGKIGKGLVVLLGIGREDAKQNLNIRRLAKKVVNLRIFPNKNSHFTHSILDIGGEILLVPQFTLYADCSRGRRPYFGQAAEPKTAKVLFEKFAAELKKFGLKVTKGKFGAKMELVLINDGPVTIVLQSQRNDG